MTLPTKDRDRYACGTTKNTILGLLIGLAIAIGVPAVGLNCSASDLSERAKNSTGTPPGVHDFLQSNCMDCHQGDEADGGLNLDALSFDLQDEATLQRWVRIFDRVADGEMPPEEYGEVDAEEIVKFTRSTQDWIHNVQQTRHETLGRVRGRRLTNLQLERTLHDLLAIRTPLVSLMPEEQRVDGFTGIASTQSMSHFQLENHLDVVDSALDAAFDRLSIPPQQDKSYRRDYAAKDIARRNTRQRCRDPEMRNGLAVVWSGRLIFYGRITSTVVRKSGWYRIKFKASSVKTPKEHGVWCSVRSGRCTSGAPLMTWIGSFEATDEPQELVYEAWLPKDHMLEIRPSDETLKQARFAGGQVGTGEAEPQNVPGLALHEMTIEEIHPEGNRELAHRRLLGNLQVSYERKGKATRMKIADKHTTADLVNQLRSFARRAMRRKIGQAELSPYARLLRQSIAAGDEPIDALRSAYRAILCSPRFLYFNEKPGKLDDYAVASRLSYLLWDSMPDFKLMQLAAEGKLRDPAVLHDQVERMLRHKRGQDFVNRLAGQWLDLDQIDFTEPDRKLYSDFDIIVKNAMLDETQLTLQDMLMRDRPAAELITGKTTYLNRRLARFYGLTEITDKQDVGDQMTRVHLPADTHRGGVLTQGAVLKVTANGTNTSPVLRGIWVSERLLGQPIPEPPESVPAIEPDIRGAKTVRQMLEKHKADTSCASCHVKIDPPGFALENFDAAGRWRDNYVVSVGRRLKDGPKVDPSFQLPDGREFDDIDEFRVLWKATPHPIARCFAEKLLTYGTGETPTFADRADLDAIVNATSNTNHGLRSLLHATVASPIFLKK